MINNKATRKIEYLWMLALTLFFAINMNYDWRLSHLIWYGCLALVFVCYLVVFNGKILINDFSYFSWMLSFMGLCAVSLLWSLSVSMGVTVIKSLVIVFFVAFFIQCSISFGFKVETMLAGYFVATLINSLYVVLTIDLTQLGEQQLGVNLLDGWNGNGIGFMTARGVLIGCYLMGKTTKKLGKFLYLAFIIALSVLTMFTGSRTAFIMLVLELILFFCLGKPKKLVRNVFFSILIVSLAFYLAMNVEMFYNVLGVRLEGLFALFSGEGEVDTSSSLRDLFIENGKQWFLEQPGFGYGINNYKVLNVAATGEFTYAHNTFIEIAVDLGIVGLVWYYSVYVYLMYRLFKFVKTDRLSVFLLTALAAALLADYGSVSYYNFYQHFLFLLGFYAVNRFKKGKFQY